MFEAFGKLPTEKEKEKTQRSPNYRNGKFQNPVPTSMMQMGIRAFGILFKFLNKPANCFPPKPLPSVKTNLNTLPSEKPVVVWFGHSSYFIKINNKNILVDPVFSGYVSPFKGMNKAFKGTNIYGVDDMPEIDVLIITHDHYDHLDYETIVKLNGKTKLVCTSLGVASHLQYWGYDVKKIKELDWHQTIHLDDDMQLTAVPARHFSGRGTTRDQTLWSGFVLATKEYKLLLGGDTGYGLHLKEIGEQYGPFDIVMLECGQYNEAWHDIHMMPEETAQAAIDVKTKALLPVHWAKFSISLHVWNDPINRVTKKGEELNVNVITPMIGEPVVIGEPYPKKRWWEEM